MDPKLKDNLEKLEHSTDSVLKKLLTGTVSFLEKLISSPYTAGIVLLVIIGALLWMIV